MQYFSLGGGNSIRLATGTAAPTVDPDAQAFITAAAITNPTQQSAINQLVVDLKGYGVWTKMKALYPFVGNTASQHKYNLKDPRDLDVAFRLVFSGGIIHDSNGITLNGVNGFVSTFFNAFTNNLNNGNISIYNRTNNAGSYYDFSNLTGAFDQAILIKWIDNKYYINSGTQTYPNFVNADARGLYAMNYNTTNIKGYKNGTLVITENKVSTGVNNNYTIGRNSSGQYSNRNYAFASVGDGLNDTEAANFYTAVQTFQTTLGRSIGTQTVSDADAQAFVTNAGIVDQVEANAINNLVIGMKADGIWSKMKAIYPFVGGTASQHKFNLKNPLDTDGAFRIVFNGGWTHSVNGALPNGVNGWADTKLIAQNVLSLNSTSIGVYSRSNTDILAPSIANVTGSQANECSLFLRTSNTTFLRVNAGSPATATTTDSRGLFIANRSNSTQINLQVRGTQTTYSNISNLLNNIPFLLGGYNSSSLFDNKELAFAFISDGLTSQNMTDTNTTVQTFQTALNRQIP
jgi:hypothetical protein